jgi:uncharacterized membrane protein
MKSVAKKSEGANNPKVKKKSFLPLPTEYIFLTLGIIFGLFFVFKNPPWQSNDEDRHFMHTYFIAHGYIFPDQGVNKIGGPLPVNLVDVIARLQGIRFSETVKLSATKMKDAANIKLDEKNKQFYHNNSYNINPVGFIPGAIGVFIGQFINDNPIWLGWWARIGCLAGYLTVIFFAIKNIPIFKNVIFFYALTPMCLYQGSSVTYDSIEIALTFLIFGLVLKFALDKESYLTWKELVLLIGIMIIHRFAKDGYPLIPFAFFLIPPKKFKLPFKPIFTYAGFAVVGYLIYKIPDWTWTPLLNAHHYKLDTPIQLKKDLVGSLPDNLNLSIKHPVKTVTNLFDNVNYFRQEWTGGTIGRFGYSYTLLPQWFFFIHGILLIIVAFLDSGKEFVLKSWQKGVSFLIGFGTIFGIVFVSYLYSPIGANQIFGLQGRYLINAVPFLLLILYNNKFNFKEWKHWGNLAIGGYIIISLIYTLYYIDGVFYQTP